MSQVAFECRSLGFPCEWAMRSGAATEVLERVRDHAKCAHNLPELPADLVAKIEAAIHSA